MIPVDDKMSRTNGTYFLSLTMIIFIQCMAISVIDAFAITPWIRCINFPVKSLSSTSSSSDYHHSTHPIDKSVELITSSQRRDLFRTVMIPFLGGIGSWHIGNADIAKAMTTSTTDDIAVEMKTFIDPEGLFALKIPKRFFSIRRTNKGDLPNESTGSGRRGSSIFNAGDLAKAEVLAVERYVLA
jgi:hypothetical protein